MRRAESSDTDPSLAKGVTMAVRRAPSGVFTAPMIPEAATVAGMDTGSVEEIYIADARSGPVSSVSSVTALHGEGLEGDRHRQHDGWAPRGTAITLVEAEAVEAITAEHGILLPPGGTRRNVVTRGVRLNDLVGREFDVGPVRCRGYELCEPCRHLRAMTGEPQLIKALAHRGGLRADILTDGVISVGDTVTSVPG
jgi:MOSC domain-containing protein YiiM